MKNDNDTRRYVRVNGDDKRKRKPKREARRPRGMVIAIVVLSMLLAASSLIALNMWGVANYYQTQLENQYQRSFFDLTGNMNNLEIKLSKLLVSNSKPQIQKNLNEVARQTESTQINLSELPTTYDTTYKTMRFVNQLGDYCKSLANKMAAGKNLSEQEYEKLNELYDTCKVLSSELSTMAEKVGTELKLVYSKQGDRQGNPLADSFSNLQKGDIEYPTMIYDGPFSDGALSAELKGLKGEEVSRETAEQRLRELLNDPDFFEITSVMYREKAEGNRIEAYNFDVTLKNGTTMFVQMSVKGGHPVLIDNKRDMDNYSLEVEGCVERAEAFVKKLGYDNLESVWASDYAGNVYVNLAPNIDGVIHYPDLVKVIVARDNGEILGLETMSYLANHTERDLPKANLTAEQARAKVSSKLEVVEVQLCLIPVGINHETLAWEISGTWNDLKYFVYIEAQDGEEVEMFRVIDSDQGTFII